MVSKKSLKLAKQKDKEKLLLENNKIFMIKYSICPICSNEHILKKDIFGFTRLRCENCGFIAYKHWKT